LAKPYNLIKKIVKVHVEKLVISVAAFFRRSFGQSYRNLH